MDTLEQIKAYEDFIEAEYLSELLENSRKGMKYLVVDFKKLSKFDITLSEELLENPDESIKSAQIAIERFDLPGDAKDYKFRIINLPKSQTILLRDIRSVHIGNLMRIECVIRQKSDVRPQAASCRFECPSCGNIIPVLQLDQKFKEPGRCGCGRKGKFKLVSKDLIDAQTMTVEENLEQLPDGQQPKKMKVFLQDDLTSALTDRKTIPGTKVILNGIINEIPIILRTGGQSSRYDLLINANSIEAVDEDFGEILISKKEEKEIKKITKDPEVIDKLVESIAPSIYGHEKIKEALLLQLVSGIKKRQDDGTRSRGDMHILLVGDPGAGKSQLLKRIAEVAPKSRFISATGASGAGLTATVVKDDFIGGWSLEAGALVLANKGIICLDELDKINKDDTGKMHEALEGQTVTVSKANIQATMPCETTVLGAANPKMGRFDPYAKTIAEQIEMPSTLINRFDLIFPIKDLPNPDKDEKLAKFVTNQHKTGKNKEEVVPPVETALLRKFIAYVRKTRPELSDEAEKIFVNYYLKMRNSGAGEGNIKTIPISARQLEGTIRMGEAYAKIRLSKSVDAQDAGKAVELMDHCLKLIALDTETGTVDIDRIATGVSTGNRSRLSAIKKIIQELEDRIGKNIPIKDLIEQAKYKNINEEQIEWAIQKLKDSGDLFEPRRGFISRI